MNKTSYSGRLLATVVASAALFVSGAQAQSYRLTAIADHDYVSALNDLGQVVGTTEYGSDGLPYVWQDGVSTNLRPLGIVQVRDINNRGEITGTMVGGKYGSHAFRYDGRSLTDLHPGGVGKSWGGAINDAGVVAGSYVPIDDEDNGYQEQVVTFAGGTVTDLGLPAAQHGVTAINNSGMVVGGTIVTFGTGGSIRSQPFVVENGSVSYLGNFGGYQGSAQDVNEAGVVVGYAMDSTLDNRAFIYVDGVKSLLDPDGMFLGSFALGINDSGLIVGSAYDSARHAFLYSEGSFHDLNGMVDSSAAGWQLDYAYDINNVGQIIGTGLDPDGNQQAFLLTPITAVPEPGTAPLVLVGLAVFGTAVIRRRKGR